MKQVKIPVKLDIPVKDIVLLGVSADDTAHAAHPLGRFVGGEAATRDVHGRRTTTITGEQLPLILAIEASALFAAAHLGDALEHLHLPVEFARQLIAGRTARDVDAARLHLGLKFVLVGAIRASKVISLVVGQIRQTIAMVVRAAARAKKRQLAVFAANRFLTDCAHFATLETGQGHFRSVLDAPRRVVVALGVKVIEGAVFDATG